MPTIREILDTYSQKYSVPNDLAYAVAWHESGWDPNSVGDYGTSFGLFQLHEGGELNLLPGDFNARKAAALDPSTNSDIALQHIGAVAALHPGADLGVIAAEAQRPADMAGYARAVDADIAAQPWQSTKGANVPTTVATGTASKGFDWNPLNHIPGVKGIESVASGTVKIISHLLDPKFWLRIGIFLLGGFVLLFAMYILFRRQVNTGISTAAKAA